MDSETTYEKMGGGGEKRKEGEGVERERERERVRESPFLFMHCPLLMVQDSPILCQIGQVYFL